MIAARSKTPGSFASIGAAIGAGLGLLFVSAVIALADCAGPACNRERLIGLAGHAVGGALAGALVGVIFYGLWRAFASLRS